MNEHYHYTESGLDFVYLVNGFEFVDGAITIHDIDGLHRLIGQWLVETRKNLSGQEMRFLRHELELSQNALASLLGVSEQSVARWEKAKNQSDASNPAAQRMLRLLYIESIGENPNVTESLEIIADLEDEIERLAEFNLSETEGWQEGLAA